MRCATACNFSIRKTTSNWAKTDKKVPHSKNHIVNCVRSGPDNSTKIMNINMCFYFKNKYLQSFIKQTSCASNQDLLLKKTRAQLYSKSKQYVLQIPWQVTKSRIDIDFKKRNNFWKNIFWRLRLKTLHEDHFNVHLSFM